MNFQNPGCNQFALKYTRNLHIKIQISNCFPRIFDNVVDSKINMI